MSASPDDNAPAPPAPPAPATEAAAPPAEPAAPSTSTSTTNAATSSTRGRYFPTTRWARVLFVLLATALFGYLVALVYVRYQLMFDRWTADGDQPQAVWHYWRYHISGAFPPGQLLTDYAYAMHAPPGWWLMMASLSTFFEPLNAAKILNVVAFVGTHFVIYFAVARRSNPFIGLAAAFLLMRNVDFSAIIAGGYARSFGPMLTLMFLGAFMVQAHRLVLVILVVQAALYPSVVLPCGLVYGVYVVVKGPMPQRLRRMAGMFVAGLLIIGFGKSQDIAAPKWWGSLVTLEEALQMPAWKSGGRVSEAPLKPAPLEMRRNVERAFRAVGTAPLSDLVPGLRDEADTAVLIVALGIAGTPVLWFTRRRKNKDIEDPFPWQIPALFLGALAAYFLARHLAFKLYLPYRPLQHVWAYCFYAGVPLLAWTYARNLIQREAVATAVAFAVAVVPVGLVFGLGNDTGPGNYTRYGGNAKLYEWIRKQPIDAVFAGEFGYVDKTPLFAHHTSYVTKNLAHPFRKGYYNECERRIRLMYQALYATKLDDVVAFAEREDVDFLIVRDKTFSSLDERLFEPVKRDMAKVFKANKAKGFALAKAPKSSVVFNNAGVRVISIAKLKAALANAPATLATPATSTTPTTPTPATPPTPTPTTTPTTPSMKP
jgi:hypothetical protein